MQIFCIFLSYFYAIHLTEANWIKPDISYHVNHGLTDCLKYSNLFYNTTAANKTATIYHYSCKSIHATVKTYMNTNYELTVLINIFHFLIILLKHRHTVYFYQKRNYHYKPYYWLCQNNSCISHNRYKSCCYYYLAYHL